MTATIHTICPECQTPGRVQADPNGSIAPTQQCAACPECHRIYRVEANRTPNFYCAFCGVFYSAQCECAE